MRQTRILIPPMGLQIHPHSRRCRRPGHFWRRHTCRRRRPDPTPQAPAPERAHHPEHAHLPEPDHPPGAGTPSGGRITTRSPDTIRSRITTRSPDTIRNTGTGLWRNRGQLPKPRLKADPKADKPDSIGTGGFHPGAEAHLISLNGFCGRRGDARGRRQFQRLESETGGAPLSFQANDYSRMILAADLQPVLILLLGGPYRPGYGAQIC